LTENLKGKSKRQKAELLKPEEAERFLALKKKHKVKNEVIAKAVGVSSKDVVSAWGKNIPARCRALLQLWEFKDQIKIN